MEYERIVILQEGKYTEENSPIVKVLLTIEQGEINKPYIEFLNRLKNERKWNGFRPGKVPNYIVEQKFGKQAIHASITNLVNQKIREIAKEHKDTVLFQPHFTVDQATISPVEPLSLEVHYFRKVVGNLAVREVAEEGLKGPEGENPSLVHVDESGFIDKEEAQLAYIDEAPFVTTPEAPARGLTPSSIHVDTCGFVPNDETPWTLKEGAAILPKLTTVYPDSK